MIGWAKLEALKLPPLFTRLITRRPSEQHWMGMMMMMAWGGVWAEREQKADVWPDKL